MDSIDRIERKQAILRALSRKHRLELRRHDPRTSFLECLLGRGDRRMADVVERAWTAGARFDSWNDQFRWDLWTEALEATEGLPGDLFVGTLPTDARLPWDHLDMRLEPRFLATEYRRALRSKLSPPCGKPAGAQVHHTNLPDHEQDRRLLVCYHCGIACDMTRMRNERGAFLAKLQVPARRWSPPEPREPSAPSALEPTSGTPRRYRILFAKQGLAALTGHLDLVRALPRIVRRAGLAPQYSRGFHPKPIMEFAPPLPLGVAGLNEVVDLTLVQEIEPEELVRRLHAVAPEGLIVKNAAPLSPQAPKLSRELAGAEYVIGIPRAMIEDLDLAPERLEAAPHEFLARKEAVVRTTRKGKTKQIDVRPAVDAVRWLSADELPADLDPAPGDRHLFLRLSFETGVHARPGEVAALVLRDADLEVETNQLVRVRLLSRVEGCWAPLMGKTPGAGWTSRPAVAAG
jgi:radical SAM-linked protein